MINIRSFNIRYSGFVHSVVDVYEINTYIMIGLLLNSHTTVRLLSFINRYYACFRNEVTKQKKL